MRETTTITLENSEVVIAGLTGKNTLVINNSSTPIYASGKEGVVPYADDVIEIPAGARDTVVGTYGTVYLLGSGRVELRGVDYVGFKQPSSSKSNGGGGALNVYAEAKISAVTAIAVTEMEENQNGN